MNAKEIALLPGESADGKVADVDGEQELVSVEEQHKLKAAAVLALQLGEGLSQSAACGRIGIDRKTYRKYLRENDALLTLRAATESTLVEGMLTALRAYLAGLARLERMMDDPDTAPRDLVAAMKLLEAQLVRFVGVIPQGTAVVEMPAIPFSFEGPVTIRVEPQAASPVVDGEFRPD